MSDDSFFERWSRRKREAAQERKREKKPDETADERAAAVSTNDAAARASKTEAAEVPFDPASLPPIESIDALSDVRAFLAPGVPTALTRAALRRVWATDPAIRDFVGLSENAWDFTTPGSIPGFEGIGGSEELRRLVAHLTEGNTPAGPEETDRPVAEPMEVTETSQIERDNVGSGPTDSSEVPAVANPPSDLLQHNKDDAASRHEQTEDQIGDAAARRGHGSALPK